MSRPASDITLAIRKLLKKNGELTYADARPLLAELGHEIAAERPAKSDAFKQFEQYEVDLTDAAAVAKAMKACGFDEKTQKAVLDEANVRNNFETESNHFNVTKWTWSKNSGKSSVSRKPETSKNTKAKTAAVVGKKVGITKLKKMPKPKHRQNAVVGDFNDFDSLDVVSENGGIAAVQAKVAEMRLEADRLEAAVASVIDLKKRVAAAA